MLKIIEFKWRSIKEKQKRRSGRMLIMLLNEDRQQFRIFRLKSSVNEKLKRKELEFKRN